MTNSKWYTNHQLLRDGEVTKYQIFEGEKCLKFPEVFQLWKTSEAFQVFYNNILADSDYEGFFWEIPPVNLNWDNIDFEFVLVNSRALPTIFSDDQPFKKYFQTTESIISFPNLGRDAQLIVPTPISEKTNYSHFAKFVRNAPDQQKNKLWEVVSTEFQKRLGEHPQWLSTSGLGVYWLHLRIDSRPKYYQYKEYKVFNQ